MIETQESRFNLERTPDAASPGAVGPTSAKEAVLAVPFPEQQADRLEAQRIAFEKDRKRERKEMADHELRAREEILSDFLEVADNLERAIASWKEGDKHDLKSVQEGVDSVLRLFRSKLERYFVTALDAKGKLFDPHSEASVSDEEQGTCGESASEWHGYQRNRR